MDVDCRDHANGLFGSIRTRFVFTPRLWAVTVSSSSNSVVISWTSRSLFLAITKSFSIIACVLNWAAERN